MKIGIVDLGTLSLRFDVFETAAEAPPRLIERYRSMPRLGEGAFTSGRLDSAAAARALEELSRVKRLAADHRLERLIAVGTGVLRTAEGSAELVAEIRRVTGIALEVISGEREAELTARGILENEREVEGLVALVDIGGGSTEISLCRHGSLQSVTSVDLGVSKLLQLGGGGRHPFPEAVVEKLRHEAQVAVDGAHLPLTEAVDHLLGSSGTIRALARLGESGGNEQEVLEGTALAGMLKEIVGSSRESALQIPGMEERRVDLMVPGLILLLTILRRLGADRIRVTKFSLRHGLLAELLDAGTAR